MAKNELGYVRKVAEMSPREIKIHNIAQMWINTYEDEGASGAARYYNRNIAMSEDHDLIVEQMKRINGHV